MSKSSISAFVTRPQSLSFDLPTVHNHDFIRRLAGHNRKMGKAASFNRKGGGDGGGGGGGGGRYFDHGGGGGGGSGGGPKRYVRTSSPPSSSSPYTLRRPSLSLSDKAFNFPTSCVRMNYEPPCNGMPIPTSTLSPAYLPPPSSPPHPTPSIPSAPQDSTILSRPGSKRRRRQVFVSETITVIATMATITLTDRGMVAFCHL